MKLWSSWLLLQLHHTLPCQLCHTHTLSHSLTTLHTKILVHRLTYRDLQTVENWYCGLHLAKFLQQCFTKFQQFLQKHHGICLFNHLEASSSTVGRHTDGGPRLNKTDLIPQRTNFRQRKTTTRWRENEQIRFACSRFRRSPLLKIGVFVCAPVFVCPTMHASGANGLGRRHGRCGSSKDFETTRGAAAWRSKTVGCLDENVVRLLDERRGTFT